MAGDGAAIRARVDQLCAALTDAGVPTSLDPGRVERGGAWVSMREARPDTFAEGSWTITAYLWLVASDVAVGDALDQLMTSLDRVLPLVDLAPDEPVDLSSSLALPNSPTYRLPAFRLTVELDTTDTEQETTT